MSAECARCGSPIRAQGVCPVCILEAPLPATMVGDNLELGDVIGEGGMGTVFEARDIRLDRRVAVKFLPAHSAEQPELRERFDREARAMAMLNHPNVVAVHDFGHSQGQSYIVMEFVDGNALSAMLPLSTQRVVEIAVQVCGALAYAHQRGLVHRDIKPDNVLITSDGQVKVADFGIARVVEPRAGNWTVTTPDVVIGTPDYMAPEAREGARPDPRMDVFSVGVLIYRAVTGRLPTGDFPALDGELDAVVKKALAYEPADRFADAAKMQRALENLSDGDDASRSASPTRGTAAGELPPDQKSFLGAVALIQTLASAVALWAFWLCVTPIVITADEVKPLIMLITEPLSDGRLVSPARFEIWPVIGATAAVGVAISMYGLLRRHWRLEGWERDAPDADIRAVRVVFAMGLTSTATYAVHLAALARFELFAVFMPIAGGIFELVTLWFFWVAILQLWRHGRPLRREWRLWVGITVAWIPPVTDLIRYLRAWSPPGA